MASASLGTGGKLTERHEQIAAPVEGGRRRADAREQLGLARGETSAIHRAADVHAADVALSELRGEKAFRAGFHACERLVREMVFVEQEHEDAPAAGIGRGQDRRRRVGRRRAASHVRDEIELLNGLPLAVLEHLEVFSGQAGHESSLFVEHDDVDFNEVRRGAERGLRRRWSGL